MNNEKLIQLSPEHAKGTNSSSSEASTTRSNEKKKFIKRSASAPCGISYSDKGASKLDIDIYDINFIKYNATKPATLESENEELKLIHQFSEMGFRMEKVLEAIDAVQCTDALTVLNYIVSKDVDFEST